MTWEDHLFQTASAGSPSYSAREFRALIAEAWDEGILEGLKVVQRGAGANMSVDINVGGGVITGDDQSRQGNYLVRCTALENKTVTAAPGSNSRLDLVVAEVLDPDSGGAAGRITQFRVIAGTPAGSPVLPALPPTAIPLAQLGPITTSTSSIPTGLITDLRVWAGERCAPGTLKESASSKEFSGWLLADGRAVSRTTYARLFDLLGTQYGVGDGSTTFNLLDLRGRSPAGLANMGTAAGAATGDTRIPAAAGGAGGNVQLQIHQHGPGDLVAPIHQHTNGDLVTAIHQHTDGSLAGPAHTHNSTVRYNQVEVQAGTGAFIQQVGTSGGSTVSEATTSAGTGAVTGVTDYTAAPTAVTGVTDYTAAPADITGVTDFTGTGGTGNIHPYAGVYVLIRT